ncbi:hypothetical protein KPH14_004705 [Odynerus spinipes]|uniref:SAM domain-containing protein n=1 Tax=Odynerus spinipes TaxID=1348599 RepID=A0AAD9RMA9_9HYME|nr:hypothetical protein KPH14_004705 [Odynerus spinipes]
MMDTKDNTIRENVEDENSKQMIESTVVKLLRTQEYTLNAVNNYGENLLHISAAYGCSVIITEILKKKENCQIINRKNKFGWTPLMQAIRNKNIDTVKLLLQRKSNVNDSTYLGISVLSIASAISKEMFQTIYKNCPSALSNATHDDISPLCVAALKNDKDLFFSLVDMGLDISKANEYTHIVMKQSKIPEIAILAKSYCEIEDYWNDVSDDIEIETESSNKKYNNVFLTKYGDKPQYISDNNNNNNKIPSISINACHTRTNKLSNLMENTKQFNKKKQSQFLNLDLLSVITSSQEQSLISPILSHSPSKEFPISPNIYFVQNNTTNLATVSETDVEDEPVTEIRNCKDISECCIFARSSAHSPVILKRLQSIRPPDLDLTSIQKDHNTTLEFIPEFSPISSPNVPTCINDENVFGNSTPTPPHYRTPPKGMVLNSQQTKMIVFLKRFGLSHHISTFLEEEIDMDLMLTLSDNDLKEIGIKDKAERITILTAIKKYQNSEVK